MGRFLNQFLQPVAILWVCLLLYTLVKLARRQWRRTLCPCFTGLFLYIVGATDFPSSLLASLERPYVGVDPSSLPEVDAVVMLGGMTTPSENDVFDFHLDEAADRFVAAVELVRQRKGRALVLGGGINRQTPNPGEGEFLRRWAEVWNVAKAPLHVLGLCRDTHDEAVRTRALVDSQGWKRLILVTSAAHMRRAEATFRRAGVDVVPFACDFKGTADAPRRWEERIVPSLSGFSELDQYLHEVVGYWVYRWRGWL